MTSELEAAFIKADDLAQKGDMQAAQDARIFAQALKNQRGDIKMQIDTDPISMGAKAELEYSPAQRVFKDIIGIPRKAATFASAASKELGGRTTDSMMGAGVSPETAANTGYAVNAGLEMLPMVAGAGAGKLAQPAFDSKALGLMQSALKPTIKNLQRGNAQAAAGTMLDEGLNVTTGGVMKLHSKIDDLNSQITELIQNSGATVDKGQVGARIQDVINRIERTNPTPQDALADVGKVYDDFLKNGLVPQNIPVQRAQELKRGIYQALRDKYGQLGSDTVEAQKALGRGFKEEINNAVPGVQKLNDQESKLLNALNVTERRVLMQANNNPGGLVWMAKDPTRMAMFMADKSSLFKSLIARMLYSNAAGPTTGAAAAELGVKAATNKSQ